MEEIIEKLHYNFIADLKKKDIDVRERALLIDGYMKKHGLSYRQLADMFNIPHTTIFGWLSVLNYSEREYTALKNNGFTEADIFNTAKYKGTRKKVSVEKNKLQTDLETALDMMKTHSKNCRFKSNSEIKDLISELKDVLNRIEMQLEINDKR